MSVISIGIQTIMPKTGTTQQSPPQQPANDNDANDAQITAKHAPPPQGMGRFVDKSV
jgi:hypothetical protein